MPRSSTFGMACRIAISRTFWRKAALKRMGPLRHIKIYRSKSLDKVEQDHRFIERRIRSMMGFKSFASAAATLDGCETANMIRKGPLGSGCPIKLFAELAA